MNVPLSLNPSNDADRLLTSAGAAQLLGVSVAFLARDRWAGKSFGSGPLVPFMRIGPRAIRYSLRDLQAHIQKTRVA
jgi:hypothetical protein